VTGVKQKDYHSCHDGEVSHIKYPCLKKSKVNMEEVGNRSVYDTIEQVSQASADHKAKSDCWIGVEVFFCEQENQANAQCTDRHDREDEEFYGTCEGFAPAEKSTGIFDLKDGEVIFNNFNAVVVVDGASDNLFGDLVAPYIRQQDRRDQQIPHKPFTFHKLKIGIGIQFSYPFYQNRGVTLTV
jgi:hypothetical protein